MSERDSTTMLGFDRAAAPIPLSMAGVAHPGQAGDRDWQKQQQVRRAKITRLIDAIIRDEIKYRVERPIGPGTKEFLDGIKANRAALGAAINEALGINTSGT